MHNRGPLIPFRFYLHFFIAMICVALSKSVSYDTRARQVEIRRVEQIDLQPKESRRVSP
jgi:hypothetical protein